MKGSGSARESERYQHFDLQWRKPSLTISNGLRMALAALADPTRRAVFERLRDVGMPAGKLTEGLPVSRPAVSQHLKSLKDAGLVAETRGGARRIYNIDPHGVGQLRRLLAGDLQEGPR